MISHRAAVDYVWISRGNGGKAGSYPVTSLMSDSVDEREATNEHKDFKAAVAEVAINDMPGLAQHYLDIAGH